MTGREAYAIWFRAAGKWSGWVRPVPFISACASNAQPFLADTTTDNFLLDAHCIKDAAAKGGCAVILDLPADEGINAGIGLVRLGFCPVPIYNGCKAQEGTRSTVSTSEIESALISGARELEGIEISGNAPPVFLTDSNRMQRFKMDAAVFDNSWDIYPQDVPSGEFILSQGIKNVIVAGRKLNKDLKPILAKYQRLNIKIYITDGYSQTKSIKFKRRLIKL